MDIDPSRTHIGAFRIDYINPGKVTGTINGNNPLPKEERLSLYYLPSDNQFCIDNRFHADTRYPFACRNVSFSTRLSTFPVAFFGSASIV